MNRARHFSREILGLAKALRADHETTAPEITLAVAIASVEIAHYGQALALLEDRANAAVMLLAELVNAQRSTLAPITPPLPDDPLERRRALEACRCGHARLAHPGDRACCYLVDDQTATLCGCSRFREREPLDLEVEPTGELS